MSTEAENKKIEDLVANLSQLTVLEMSKLKQALEDTWGVKAAAAAAVVAAPAAGGAAEAPAAEATDFKVVLEKTGSNKIAVIKEIRAVTQLGLKEAKELADKAGSVIKESAPKKEAEEIAEKIKAAGGEVSLVAV